jgi:hypothetical protein
LELVVTPSILSDGVALGVPVVLALLLLVDPAGRADRGSSSSSILLGLLFGDTLSVKWKELPIKAVSSLIFLEFIGRFLPEGALGGRGISVGEWL